MDEGSPPEVRVVCAWCPRAFPSMPLLLDHVEEVHLPVFAATERAARRGRPG
jgi:hypothetical protein